MAFWDPRSAPGLPKLVNVRHEQTAVYAADGWARTSGRLGAATVTTGPGAANTLAAFGEAAMSSSPVVLVASEVPTTLVGAGLRRTLHSSADQAAMFRQLAKASFTPRSVPEAAAAVKEATTLALCPPRGPVYLGIPADVLTAEAVLPGAGERMGPLPPKPDEAAVAAAARLIDSGKDIVIWAGGGVVAAGAGQALGDLAMRLQAPVLTTFGSRGALGAGHPCDIGLPPHEPEVEALIASGDVLVAVGSNIEGMMTKNASLRLPPRVIDINLDFSHVPFGYPVAVFVESDAKFALEALLAVVVRRKEGLAKALPAVKEAVWARLRADPRTAGAATFVASVERAATGRAVVLADMAVPGYWLGGYYGPGRPRAMHYPVGWGTLGYALPASVGAAAVGELPALAVCGDGGFLFAVGELATIAQEQLPVTTLVVDDGGYGMLRYGRSRGGQPTPGADLLNPDFVALARAFGVEATTVADAGPALEQALREALSAGTPRVLVLKASLFPPRTTSPRWPEGA
jgi:thiamine pyrophosphate-dependent acetolactate synthase large subunit-like protein